MTNLNSVAIILIYKIILKLLNSLKQSEQFFFLNSLNTLEELVNTQINLISKNFLKTNPVAEQICS